jgi:hypothetical protein
MEKYIIFAISFIPTCVFVFFFIRNIRIQKREQKKDKLYTITPDDEACDNPKYPVQF